MSGIRAVVAAFLLASAQQETSVDAPVYLPPYRPVSLKLERAPARAALKELAERTGLSIDLTTCPDGREVTLDLRDVPTLEALSEICRAAMLGWKVQNPVDWRGRSGKGVTFGIWIHGVASTYYRPSAVQFVRHYRIDGHLVVDNSAEPKARDRVSLRIQPAPGVRPHSVSALRLAEATDEEGRDVLSSLGPEGAGFRILGLGTTSAGFSRSFDPAARLPVRLSRLRGSVTFRYPREVRWVRFILASPGPAQPDTALGLVFSLLQYSREGRNHDVTLKITKADGSDFRTRDLENDLPFDFTEVEILTAGGERLSSNDCTGFGGKAGWAMQIRVTGSKDEIATEARIPFVENFIEDVVEFDLRDVVLR